MHLHKPVSRMSDAEVIAHMEDCHPAALAVRWPQTGPGRNLADRHVWVAYHDHFVHKSPRRAGHDHKSYVWTGWEQSTMRTDVSPRWEQRTPCNCLHPPTHQPDCTGRQGLVVISNEPGATAQDRLWAELVRCIGLLRGKQKGDEKLAEFARGLATGLAYIRSPLSPNVDAIRKDAMTMWKKANDAE